MLSDEEIEAAREAWRKYWYEEDVPRNTRDGITAALEAAARVRAEDNAGGPVAWGEDIDGKIVSVRLDKSRHCTVPLYRAPQSSRQPETVDSVLLDAVRKIASTDLSGCADMTTAEIFGALSRMHETARGAVEAAERILGRDEGR